jgi:hypothetical protein
LAAVFPSLDLFFAKGRSLVSLLLERGHGARLFSSSSAIHWVAASVFAFLPRRAQAHVCHCDAGQYLLPQTNCHLRNECCSGLLCSLPHPRHPAPKT